MFALQLNSQYNNLIQSSKKKKQNKKASNPLNITVFWVSSWLFID